MKSKIIYDPYEAIGGLLCLDFVNTLGGNRKSTTFEYLHSYKDLVNWAFDLNLIDNTIKNGLLAKSSKEKEKSNEATNYAIIIRETLYRIITAFKDKNPVLDEDLTFFNNELQKCNSHKVLVYNQGSFTWSYTDDTDLDFNRVLWPVIESASYVFSSNNSSRIRECGNDSCGWLFLDQTKNNNRRWCDMAICGNRVKQRNFQSKVKTSKKSIKKV